MLDISKLDPELINFLKERNIPKEEWERYLDNKCNTINMAELSRVDKDFRQGIIDEITYIRPLGVKYNRPEMILYELNTMTNTDFVSTEYETAFLRLVQSIQLPYHKLEYFRELNGQSDVIKDTMVMPNKKNVISYYAIFSKEDETYTLTATQKNNTSNFTWKQNDSIMEFVLFRFKAFRDRGITFTNINSLVDEYTKTLKPKTRARIDK